MHGHMPCHIIFDVMMNFTMKYCYVDTGWYAPKFDEIRQAGVVSCESVNIACTYATLNGIDITEDDIQNSYLTEPSSKKYCTKCGPDFVLENEEKKTIIVRALYGLY